MTSANEMLIVVELLDLFSCFQFQWILWTDLLLLLLSSQKKSELLGQQSWRKIGCRCRRRKGQIDLCQIVAENERNVCNTLNEFKKLNDRKLNDRKFSCAIKSNFPNLAE